MAVYSLRRVQHIPVSLAEAWEFFSSPANLQTITPANMGFRILSQPYGEKAYAGQIIEYKISPLMGIPLYWMTEITRVEEGRFFVDEQRFGPYRFWHHQHHFREVEGGVEMTDIVHYTLPLGFLGRWAHSLFVKKQLKGIFDYRYRRIGELFGSGKDLVLPQSAG